MSEFRIYKDQIEPYKYLLIERIRDIQKLVRDKNRIISENGASYILVYADDLVQACKNLVDVIPPDVHADTSPIQRIYRELVNYSYEDYLDPLKITIIQGKLNELVAKVHECLRTIMNTLASRGLLLRSKSVMGVEEE